MDLSSDQEMTTAAAAVQVADAEAEASTGTATEMLPGPSRTSSLSLDNGPYLKLARGSQDTSNHRAVFEIFLRHLTVKSLGRAMCVCKSWKAVAAAEEGLWHRHCALLYPALLSPAVSKQIAESCGFYRFFLNRLLPPARAPKVPFTLEDVLFFLDISYHGSPVFSHVFRYEGGNAVVPYSPDCYVDSGAVFPSSDSLDKDAFRRTMMVNWTAIRRTDGKGTCLVRSIPDRSSSSSISFDALLAAVPNKANEPSAAPGVGAVAVLSPRPNATQKVQPSSQLPALKLVFSTTLGGPLGEQFYGMMKVSFALPVRERFLHQRGSSGSSSAAGNGSAAGAKASAGSEVTPVNVLSRSGGLEIDISALKDRLGGTVRVDIAGTEFLLILAALQWL